MGGEIVFEESIVRNHRWAGKYLSNIDQLCRDEENYGNNDYFHKCILCLDMDAILNALKEIIACIDYDDDSEIKTAIELIQDDIIWNSYSRRCKADLKAES